MIKFIKKIILVLIGLSITIFVTFPISLNLYDYSFNFADNAGYAAKLFSLKSSFNGGTPFYLSHDSSVYVGESQSLLLFSPLWESLYILLSYFIDPYLYINIAIILNIFLSFIFSYILFLYISRQHYLSIFGAIIFGFSSLIIYATWLNLLGVFFIPLIVIFLLRLRNHNKNIDYFYLFLFTLLLALSSTYYLPFIGIIYFFHIILFKGNFWKLILIFIIIFSTAFSFYKLPFFLIDSQGGNNNFKEIYNENKIKSIIDPATLIVPNEFNSFTKRTKEFTKSSLKTINTNYSISSFRYSFYIPLFIFLVLVLSLTINYRHNTSYERKIFTFFGLITISSFVFLLGDKIIIFGYDTGINGLLYYVKQLPNGEVLRKSHYFFFLLTFGMAGMVVTGLRSFNDNKTLPMYIVLGGLYILSTPYMLNRTYHDISRIYLNCENINNSNIVQLPNTGHSDSLYNFHLLNSECENVKTFKYRNLTIPVIKPFFHENYTDVTALINGEGIESIESDILDYIIVYKKSIVHFFGFQTEGSYYKNTIKQLEGISNLRIIKDTPDYRIYEVIK